MVTNLSRMDSKIAFPCGDGCRREIGSVSESRPSEGWVGDSGDEMGDFDVGRSEMSMRARAKHELKAVAVTAVYFAVWFGALLLIKALLLAEYDIAVYGVSAALVGALLLAKVVVVLERVPLGSWVGSRAAWVGVALRTALYAVGVLAALLLERAVRGWAETGDFGAGVRAAVEPSDVHHLWANLVFVTGGLLVFNALAVIRRRLGEGGLYMVFLMPESECGRSPDGGML